MLGINPNATVARGLVPRKALKASRLPIKIEIGNVKSFMVVAGFSLRK